MEIKINLNINDRIVNFVKKMFSGKRLIVSVTVLTLTTGILLYAAPVVIKTFHSGDVISAADVNANFEALRDKIAAVEANSNGAPVGTIIAFAGATKKPDGITNNVPAGWLLCDGSAYNRTNPTYAPLFDVISDNWGSGDGVSTFNVPDLRGVSLRGSNKIGSSSRGDAYADPDFAARVFLYNDGNQRSGNNELIGSFQLDAIPNITGNFDAIERNSYGHGTPAGAFTEVNSHDSYDGGANVGGGRTYYFDASRSSSIYGRSSLEARSKNAAVHYIIKY